MQIHQTSVPQWASHRIKFAKLCFYLQLLSKTNWSDTDGLVPMKFHAVLTLSLQETQGLYIVTQTTEMTPAQLLSSPKWSKPASSLPPPKQNGWYHLSDKYFGSLYMTGAFPTRAQETLRLNQSTYDVEVGWICRARVSAHPGRDASLHMNNGSPHAVDVCFCRVASAEDNFRTHVNLWRIVRED